MTDPATGRESHTGKAGFFSGKAGYYARYRRGYPQEVFDTIISRFALTLSSEILDLGCGTGNVAIPLAERGFRIHAIDPESEMLLEALRCEAAAHTCGDILAAWVRQKSRRTCTPTVQALHDGPEFSLDGPASCPYDAGHPD